VREQDNVTHIERRTDDCVKGGGMEAPAFKSEAVARDPSEFPCRGWQITKNMRGGAMRARGRVISD
jgi:hypothetical protein